MAHPFNVCFLSQRAYQGCNIAVELVVQGVDDGYQYCARRSKHSGCTIAGAVFNGGFDPKLYRSKAKIKEGDICVKVKDEQGELV